MTSSGEKGSLAPAGTKLNPQAFDFIPITSSAGEAASEPASTRDSVSPGGVSDLPKTQSENITTVSDDCETQRPRKPRHRRRRHFEPLDLSKIPSVQDKPVPDTSFVYNRGRKIAVNKRAPRARMLPQFREVPGYIGAGQQDNNPNATTVYGHALTWKSENVKAKDEYSRMRRNVRAVAPEHFADKARPSNEKADIFPQNVGTWVAFKSDSVKDRLKELAEDTKKMGDMVEATRNMDKDGVPREKRVPKSAFGPDGKIFKDSLGPVMSQPTIWSEEYLRSAQPKADWPTRAEMLEDGDQRENSQVQTRGGRHLPMPRFPQKAGDPYVSFKDRPTIPQHPLDQTGPLYRDGLGEITEPLPAEIEDANDEMNNDPAFEAQDLHLLGNDLMGEIGRWKPPVVPEWQSRQRQEQKEQHEAGGGLSLLQGMHKMGLGPAIGAGHVPGHSSGAGLWNGNGIGQKYGQPASASQDSAGGSGPTPAMDMTGWTFMGTENGEEVWMAPWGQVFRKRGNYWY